MSWPEHSKTTAMLKFFRLAAFVWLDFPEGLGCCSCTPLVNSVRGLLWHQFSSLTTRLFEATGAVTFVHFAFSDFTLVLVWLVFCLQTMYLEPVLQRSLDWALLKFTWNPYLPAGLHPGNPACSDHDEKPNQDLDITVITEFFMNKACFEKDWYKDLAVCSVVTVGWQLIFYTLFTPLEQIKHLKQPFNVSTYHNRKIKNCIPVGHGPLC